MVLKNAIGVRYSNCQFGIIAMINSIELLLGQVAAYLDDLSAGFRNSCFVLAFLQTFASSTIIERVFRSFAFLSY
jgi:hypothetical protein